jgi:hypothetical protein
VSESKNSVEIIAKRLDLRSKIQKGANLAGILALVITLYVLKSSASHGLGIGILAVASFWAVFSLINARCPHCAQSLSWLGVFDHCAACGLTIDVQAGKMQD